MFFHVKGYRTPDWDQASIVSSLGSLFPLSDEGALEPIGTEDDWTLGLLAPVDGNAASSSSDLPGLSSLAPLPVPPGEGAPHLPQRDPTASEFDWGAIGMA